MSATERAAIIRGAYTAVGIFVATFLSVYLQTDDLKVSTISGGIAAAGALGFRGGVEGIYDSHRDKTGAVKPSDVGQR